MRVLHVIPSVSKWHGGPSRAIVLLERALTDAGVSVTTLTTDDDGPGRRFPAGGAPDAPSGVERVYRRKRSEFYKLSPSLALWLWSNVRRFDVVHVHALYSFSSVAAAAIARLRGVPYVVRPLGTLARYGMENRRPLLKRLSFALCEGPLVRRAGAVHFTSEREREEAEGLGVTMRGIVIPLGIATGDHMPADRAGRAATSDSTKTLLYLSRLDPKKNVEGLLHAMALLVPRLPGLTLSIGGAGEPDYERSLRALATSLDLDEHVRWLGHIEAERKSAALAAADAFVLPSHSENFGIALVEAMLAGLPSIIGRSVALAAEIERHGGGIVVDPEPAGIAAGIAQLLGDPNLARAMGERARQHAQRTYSATAMGQALVALYGTLSVRRSMRILGKNAFSPQTPGKP